MILSSTKKGFLLMLKVCPLGSGSKGNCVYLQSDKAKILIDAGLSFAEIKRRLSDIDVRLYELDGVIITHEHNDHITGLSGFRGSGIPIFVHTFAAPIIGGKFQGLELKKISEQAFDFADLSITPFKIPHDAVYPLGYRISSKNKTLSVATDVGFAADNIIEAMKDSDCIVVEANHDESLLINGGYPKRLKERILGGRGHLSNASSAELLSKIITRRTSNLLLAHLSEENNLPELAFETVAKKLAENGFYERGDFKIGVLKQNERGSFFDV
ncbi:MAG: MBL fold metallo-hydrolase [Clostridiales bacterium]|jgi:phosphoribosyl 1,2-cyclic phosphodiesterase|nr:MBL fold metallo-hydrolase [Clostridiales bacterium]